MSGIPRVAPSQWPTLAALCREGARAAPEHLAVLSEDRGVAETVLMIAAMRSDFALLDAVMKRNPSAPGTGLPDEAWRRALKITCWSGNQDSGRICVDALLTRVGDTELALVEAARFGKRAMVEYCLDLAQQAQRELDTGAACREVLNRVEGTASTEVRTFLREIAGAAHISRRLSEDPTFMGP